MVNKQLLSEALTRLIEGNKEAADKLYEKAIEEAKVSIIAKKLTEGVEEEIPTDDKVETLEKEIEVEEPTTDEEPVEELDLDAEVSEEVPGEEAVEETTPVVPVETAEEALADSGEEVGIEEDDDFLALVNEFNKVLEDEAIEVPSEEVATEEPAIEEVPGEEEVPDEEPVEDVDLDTEVTEEEPIEEPAEKQEEIDIEKFIK